MVEHAKRSLVLAAGYAPADRLRIEAAISKAQWLQVVCFVDEWVEVMAGVKKYWFDTVVLPAGIRG